MAIPRKLEKRKTRKNLSFFFREREKKRVRGTEAEIFWFFCGLLAFFELSQVSSSTSLLFLCKAEGARGPRVTLFFLCFFFYLYLCFFNLQLLLLLLLFSLDFCFLFASSPGILMRSNNQGAERKKNCAARGGGRGKNAEREKVAREREEVAREGKSGERDTKRATRKKKALCRLCRSLLFFSLSAAQSTRPSSMPRAAAAHRATPTRSSGSSSSSTFFTSSCSSFLAPAPRANRTERRVPCLPVVGVLPPTIRPLQKKRGLNSVVRKAVVTRAMGGGSGGGEKSPLYLGIDMGTSGGRAMVIDGANCFDGFFSVGLFFW